MRRRIEGFDKETMPVATWMRDNGRHIITINADGTREQVYEHMQRAFTTIINAK
jgi:adenylate kinase family enzyme